MPAWGCLARVERREQELAWYLEARGSWAPFMVSKRERQNGSCPMERGRSKEVNMVRRLKRVACYMEP